MESNDEIYTNRAAKAIKHKDFLEKAKAEADKKLPEKKPFELTEFTDGNRDTVSVIR